MHPDGPKLHAIALESQPGQVPVRTGGMRLMTSNGGTINLPDQVTGEIQYNFTEHIAQTGSIRIKDPERKPSLGGDISPPTEMRGGPLMVTAQYRYSSAPD
ncbi:hypothetical protein [Oryza sativa Japonica Group]|uniref:Uncharacterized protein OJ1460_H08.12 n=1 Tax=Oryza sativa subsp. japonica TaxID=39947 RepID=Q5VNG6_ORYSJ|nr:hypothetical protein [Oryza sativa Japonica Group]